MSLGASVYKMVIDTRNFVDGVVLTRKELALQKTVLESVRPAVESYGTALDALDNLNKKGAISVDELNAANRELRAGFPENTAAAKTLTEALADGEAAMRSFKTAENALIETERKHHDALAANEQLLRDNAQTHGQYEQNLKRLLATSPDVIADKKRMAEETRRENENTQRWIGLNNEFMPATMQAKAKLIDLKAGFAAGKVSQESYRNGLIQLTATQLTGIPVIGQFAGTLASVGPIGIAAAAGLGIFTAGTALVRSAVRTTIDHVTDQIQKIDDLATAADTINVPIDQFQKMAHAADMADISQEQFSSGTEKMLNNVSKAADGNKKLGVVFDKLGLDTSKLRDGDAPETLLAITQAIDKLPNAADRVRASTAIFGSPDFLRLDTRHITEAISLYGDLGGGINALDRAAFDELDDATKNMNAALDATWKKVTLAVTPALTDAAEAALSWIVAINQSETAQDTLQGIADKMQSIVSVAREFPAAVQSWLPSLDAVKAANPKFALALGAADVVGGLFDNGMGEQQRKSRELDEKLKPVQESGRTEDRNRADAKAAAKLADDDAASSVDNLTKELTKELEVLKDAAEYAGMTKAEITLLKLAEEGASQATRDAAHAMASQVAEFDRQKKATEELEKATKTAADKAEAAEKRRTDSLKQISDGLDEQAAKLRGGEREQLGYNLAQNKASEAETAAALAKFDSNKAAEKTRDATKMATDAIKDYEKQIRQSGMTPDQKKRDDLKTAGATDEQLKVVDTLQKELALREAIHKEINATSGVIRSGSHEAADSFAKANQLNVRRNFFGPLAGSGVAGATATVPGAVPVVTGASGARNQLMDQLGAGVGPKPMIVPPMNEQTKLQQKANEHLSKIANKPPVSITVEEVTL